MPPRAGSSSQSRPRRSSPASGDQAATSSKDPASMTTKSHRRSRDGCYTCRLRRKKCDETHPNCVACSSLGVSCEYRKPSWWISTQARALQKERIKRRVRETKDMQKEVALQEYIRHVLPSRHTPPVSQPMEESFTARHTPPVSQPMEESFTARHTPPVSQPMEGSFMYDLSTPYLPTPTTAPLVMPNTTSPLMTTHTPLMPTSFDYDAYDAGIGSSVFVPNPDTSLMQDASFYMFNPMANPLLPTPSSTTSSAPIIPTTAQTTPALQNDDWYQGFAEPPTRTMNAVPLRDTEFPGRPLSLHLQGKMSSNNREDFLLRHFVDSVLQLLFPILDLHREGPSRARDILHSLETNKSYYHCCLSVAAIHLKTVKKQRGKRVSDEIMRHRYAAVSELQKALMADNGHDTILDATLAMLFFQSSVGSPENDNLPDISWSAHFTAVTNLINRLGLLQANPYTTTPFSVTLSSWIDILGATMLGRSPQFAHVYRTNHMNGLTSGLRELMGCDDRIMYLISEIACLECLKRENRIDDYTLGHHVTALVHQIDAAENSVVDPTLENPMAATGIIQADKLTKNMTAIFRVAARIYLYSLTASFHDDQQSTKDLVQKVADLLEFIPAGPLGFDRSLVWPMLITGAFSTPGSNFRALLDRRVKTLGPCNDFGSFGRMYTVLQEVWSLSDDTSEASYSELAASSSSQAFGFERMAYPSQSIGTVGQRIKKRPIHWRDVMGAREWQYLLL
ncbi:fungal-specific transcription factor domain-containing protein [Aspergillus californicus]